MKDDYKASKKWNDCLEKTIMRLGVTLAMEGDNFVIETEDGRVKLNPEEARAIAHKILGAVK